MPRGDVVADGMAAVAVDSAFALLEVDRVRRRVPVHDRVAPPVEVDALLADAVVASTNGQNGLLNAARTSGCRASSPLLRAAP